MAGSPNWKVYNAQGEYIAACKHVEDAAVICAAHGDGTTIRHGHGKVVWAEGKEAQPAGESYDHVHAVVMARLDAIHRAAMARYYGGIA